MLLLVLSFAFPAPSLALAQQEIVVPAAYAQTDASAQLWLPGTPTAMRQQILVAASHLQALPTNAALTSIAWRREIGTDAWLGGDIQLTVRIGTSQRAPLDASPTFAQNEATMTTVFAGTLTVPALPALAGPSTPWNATTMLRVPFATPWPVAGTDVIVDVVGRSGSQPIAWWSADAAREAIAGTATDVGDGCGTFGGSLHHWASAEEGTLVAGGSALLAATGTPQNLALAVFGTSAIPDLHPLQTILPGAGASCHIHLTDFLATSTTMFGPLLDPAAPWLGGIATVRLPIPSQPWVLGATLATQWMDVAQSFAVSNAVRWTVAPALPTLGMTVVQGDPQAGEGEVLPTIAPVLRFEYQ